MTLVLGYTEGKSNGIMETYTQISEEGEARQCVAGSGSVQVSPQKVMHKTEDAMETPGS